MKYLVPLSILTISKAQELYDKGYVLNFNYKGIIPYVEIYKGE